MIDPQHPDYANHPASPSRPAFGYAPADAHAPPAVTVVTPFHDTGDVFRQTAACVLGQSFQQWEWLIVNDGSTDSAALSLLDEYRRRDPRIRVIDHPQNRGLPAARNTGFAEARSDFVFLLDDDDLIEPTTLEKAFWYLRAHPSYAMANGWSVGFGASTYLWQLGFERGAEFLQQNLTPCMAMIRRSAYQAIGGFAEDIRGGMEDWDFWLHLASRGMWGGTIPEYLTWYRRRADHGDRWQNLAGPQRREAFIRGLRERYPRLYDGTFPRPAVPWPESFEAISEPPENLNRLAKRSRRLLMIVPWLRYGGADKFNLDLLEQLTRQGWEVTVVTTLPRSHNLAPLFARYTPDVFILEHFLRPAERPAFLRYLIDSRQPDLVLLSSSEQAYLLLPYLRAFCPTPTYIDYCHMEQHDWKSGGYPRYGAGVQDQLDLNIVCSEHLKNWMSERGADPTRIDIAYLGVDPEHWRPDADVRRRVRAEFNLGDNDPVILFTGRISDQKQPAVLGGALAALADRGADFRALIAGDGEDEAWLKGFINERGLGERVRLLGAVPSERVLELLRASDILFLPSRWEGIALSIYEAMGCGLAIVGADVGGQRELVTPDCGVLIDRATERAEIDRYAAELARLVRDLPRCREMGRNGRRRVQEHFTVERMMERLLRAFARAADLHVQAPRDRLSPGLARELAVQGIELTRITAVADEAYFEHRRLQSEIDANKTYCAELAEAREYFLTTIAELKESRGLMEQELAAQQAQAARLQAFVNNLQSRWWWRAARGIARTLRIDARLRPPQD
ncbi:MAG: glycosyltransferase [Phycisphaerae bacterium]|jgi:glycosyltransferase involved in cell wall biosynthesis